jgi:hypothetical protein
MAHLMYPRPTEAGDFPVSGIGGGHDEAVMKQFLKQHPEYHLEPVGDPVPFAGTQVQKYDQYMWTGGGPVTGKPPKDPGWTIANDPKTTVENMDVLLTQTEKGFNEWLNTKQAKDILTAGTPDGGKIFITTSDGMPLMMFYAFDGSKWKIVSSFPDGKKF